MEKKPDMVKDMMERLENGVKAIQNSEEYKAYLQTMSKFTNYSFYNSMLIHMQNPDATLVAGFRSWEKNFERHVKKGEKGIRILAPVPVKKKKTGSDEEDVLGKEETEEPEIAYIRYRTVSVFDVSQTEGKPLPDFGPKELSGDMEDFDAFYGAVSEFSPAEIRFDEIPGDAKGYYSSSNKEIVIRDGMSEAQTAKTMVHEVAHAWLHDREKMASRSEKKNRSEIETEAESVAFVVSSHFGLDTSDYSFPYVAGWLKGKNLKDMYQSVETIRRFSAEMIQEISRNMERFREEELEQGRAR